MCTGYTYGTTREVMLAIDDSGSMGLGGGASVPPYVVQAIGMVDPRCPKWATIGYRSLANAGFPPPPPPFWPDEWLLRPFRRGRTHAQSMLQDFSYTEGYGENPGVLMLKAGDLWAVPTDEQIEVRMPTGGEDRVGKAWGWGGRELHNGPPRRIMLIVGDEGSGIGNAGSEMNDAIIASLQAAEITVLAVNTWPQGGASLDNGGMTAICEATGGEIIQDAMNSLFVETPGFDEFGEPIIIWEPRSQAERDEFVEDVADMIRRHKWRDVGYPFKGDGA